MTDQQADMTWWLRYAGEKYFIRAQDAEKVKGWRTADGGLVNVQSGDNSVTFQFSESIPFALVAEPRSRRP